MSKRMGTSVNVTTTEVFCPLLYPFGVAEVSLQRFAGEILTAQAESDGQAQHERNAGLEADETPQT